MYRIAIVEDEKAAEDVLSSHLSRYAAERDQEFQTTWFPSAMEFETTRQQFDLVFLDIQMPGIDGMEAAQLMRTYDEQTPIIFVTNLAQYALHGYEVDALDFIVKPVQYYNFRMKMDSALRHMRRNGGRSIAVNLRDGMRVIPLADIEYVEVVNHDISYHLVGEPEAFVAYGSLSKFEQDVEGSTFVRISNSCMVNMNLIRSVKGQAVSMRGGDTLFFSRSKKKAAVDAITSFLGNGL